MSDDITTLRCEKCGTERGMGHKLCKGCELELLRELPRRIVDDHSLGKHPTEMVAQWVTWAQAALRNCDMPVNPREQKDEE